MKTTREMIVAIRERSKLMGLKCQCTSDGSINAKIAVIAEAPAEREVTMGLPLVGPSGRVLWEALGKHNIRRTGVYVTNVVKRQLIYNREKQNIGADEMQHWQQLLKWELSQLPNLKYVLMLGGPAMEALTGEKGVNAWRGSVVPIKLKHVETHVDKEPTVVVKDLTGVITFNPAMVMREPKTEPVFRMDLHKLTRVMDGTFKTHDIEYHINPSPDEAVQYMERMQDEKLPVSFDIETMSGETACVGFANTAHSGMCVNFRDTRTHRWSTTDERRVRVSMQRLFANDAVQFVAQNGMFDCTWLWYKDHIRVHKVWFDTMLSHHTLYSQLPHNLGFLTAQYTDHPYYKDDGKTWREGGDIDQFWRYNIKDVCITKKCQEKMQNELAHFDQTKFFFDHVMRLQPHLVRMTVGGLRVDAPFKEVLTSELTDHVAQLHADFNDKVRKAVHDPTRDTNPDSWQQLGKLFFKELGLIGRGNSTDAVNRKRMYDNPNTGVDARAMLKSLDEYKTEKKFLGTYATMRVDPDGRIRTEYKQTGVQSAPGRLSSAQVMWGSGGNFQNWPERAHRMVITDPDYRFVYFDLSQAEARVVAWLANIDTWIEQFEKARFDGSFDCHVALASDMFDIPYEDVPTYDRDEEGNVTLRFVAKRCRHGLNYRMAADRLAETTGLPRTKATEAYNLYHSNTPELRVWWNALEDEVRKHRQLVSPKGRILRVMERITDEALEAIVAFKPQSFVGDFVCQCIYECEDDDEWPINARMCLNIHDALIALVHKDDVHTAARIMRKYAEQPNMVNGKSLIIPADLAVSTKQDGYHRWSSLKKVKHLDDITRVMEAA